MKKAIEEIIKEYNKRILDLTKAREEIASRSSYKSLTDTQRTELVGRHDILIKSQKEFIEKLQNL